MFGAQLFYGGFASLSGIVLIIISLWSVFKLDHKAKIAFIAINVGGAGWALFSGLEILANTLYWKSAYGLISTTFVQLIPISWAIFALQYTNQEEKLTTPLLAFLFLGAMLPLIALATNQYHNLYFEQYYLINDTIKTLYRVEGPLYYINYIYAYLVTCTAYLYLAWFGLQSGKLHRKQFALMLFGFAIPISFNLLSKTSLPATSNIDLTAFGLGIWGLIITYVFFREKFFDVTPIARHRVITTLEDALIVVDQNKQITDWNATAEQLFGHNFEKNTTLCDLPEELHTTLNLDQTPNTQQPQQKTEWKETHTISFTPKNATKEHHYNVRVSPVTSQNDHLGYAILLRDITELREKQEELERQNERLDNFAGILAHDLRNPLEIAKGYTDIAEETGNEEAFNKVNKSHTRIENMIDDVLTLARQGQAIDEKQLLQLKPLAQNAWENVDTKDATLTVNTDQEIEGDESRLTNLFENLFRNSVTHAGTDITMTIGDLDNGFFVQDDGPGIPEENQDEIFDHGYTTEDEGTGFGLSIIQEIVEAHGWTIKLADTSNTDTGARFEIQYNTE